MKLKLHQLGDPVLRQVARELNAGEIGSDFIRQLIEHMKEAMRDAPGVGLAAPQIGLPLQLAVIEDRPEYLKDVSKEELRAKGRKPVSFHAMINPRIVRSEGETQEFFEGCLSFAGYAAIVPRAHKVTVEYLDETGKRKTVSAEGWYARILQHEIDHLNGTAYVDRMHTRTLTTMENFNRNWKSRSEEDVLRMLK
ncbi:MAG TPA: peptide deformylase [Terriglobales bacterium]|nr:peptide deformylase [Terriglobales bacterium]